jgi:DNA primase
MLSQETVESVKRFPDIVAIISDYVSLKRRGRNFIGLCPFHSEKTPSFTVSPEKKLFHCFGCQVSGDHIGFVMQMDQLSFTEAVRHIATRIGISIVEEELSPEKAKLRSEREEMQRLCHAAREAFVSYVDHEGVHGYIHSRGLSETSLAQFHLGYSPKEFDLAAYLISFGFSPDIFLKSGLFYETAQGKYMSRFRERLIFPVLDHQGRTVGFGGRILSEASESNSPKYMNSEETPFFNKRRLLYGLDLAKSAIREKGSVILMEGYMDVIMAHQFGFGNVVGTMGTALTGEHVQLLKRFVNTVYLALDQDDAGLRAIERSVELLRQNDMKVFVIQMSEKDPADLLQKHGADHFQTAIDQALPLIIFRLEKFLNGRKQIQIEDVPEIIDSLLPLVDFEHDAMVRRHYIKILSSKLGIDEELVVAKMKKKRYNVRDRFVLSPTGKKKHRYQKAEESLIYLIASDLTIRYQALELSIADLFLTPVLQNLLHVLINSDQTDTDLLELVSDHEQRQELARILVEGDIQNTSVQQQWQDYVKDLRDYHREQKIVLLREQIVLLEQSGQDAEATQLLHELQALIQPT